MSFLIHYLARNLEWHDLRDNSGPRHLSWGCVVMHLDDIQKLYDQIPEGTMVVIR